MESLKAPMEPAVKRTMDELLSNSSEQPDRLAEWERASLRAIVENFASARKQDSPISAQEVRSDLLLGLARIGQQVRGVLGQMEAKIFAEQSEAKPPSQENS